MKKLILSLVATVATAGSLYAQYTPDALRFSQTNYGSSARFKSMGGAQIGVGGDMSSLGGNPAGLGLFTKSEFSLTPEFNMVKGKASFLGQTTSASKDRLNLNNIGAVFYSPTFKPKGQDPTKGVISAVFGVGYNRNNDFTANHTYQSSNVPNSVTDYFTEEANRFHSGAALDNYTIEKMALGQKMIDYNAATDKFLSNVESISNQKQSEIRTGSTSELNVAGALNISNKFYIGASIAFVNVRYLNDRNVSESGFNDTYSSKYDLSYNVSSEVKGSGINGRLGLIYRPETNLRLGVTFQTPTWLYFDDVESTNLNSKLYAGTMPGLYSDPTATSSLTYQLRTPLKGSFGASYVIGNRALISADIDYIDYSTMHYSLDQDNNQGAIDRANQTIKANYKETVNYRIGAEYKLDNAFSLRAGYGNNGSALKNDKDNYFASKIYTGGLGYRINNYYFDLAYQRVENNVDLSGYYLNNESEPVANIKVARNNVFLTFGVRF